ncbi:hypothetical protein L218DRAFT_986652 [Marasmius fiardii PR-910]|nr:hypothetical protein L218DRAFT_986652 [Marasmius fiardii PR-910]
MFTALRRAVSSTQACHCRAFRYSPAQFQILGRCLSTSRILYGSPRIVYLGNIPFNTELDDIKDRAEPFGALARITMPNDSRDRPGGFANIEFQEESSARKFLEAVQKDGLVISNRTVSATLVETHQEERLGLPPNQTLHVTGFPSQPTVEDVEMIFERFGSSVTDIRIGAGYTRPYAHVQFVTKEAAAEAHKILKMEPVVLGEERLLHVDFAARSSRPRAPRTPQSTLYFRGMITEAELRALLRPHHQGIQRIYFLPQDAHRKHRAGHIICHNVETATAILETYGDRVMLEYSFPKKAGQESLGSRGEHGDGPGERKTLR